MANVVRTPIELMQISDFGFFSDFVVSPDTTNVFALTVPDSGSVSVSGVGGVASLVASDGSVADNDEAYLANKNAVFKPLGSQPIYAEALIQFTEANTDDANVFFGLASSVAANLLVDNGAGPRASGAVIGIYKVDGGTVWRCVSRNGSTYTDSVSTATAAGANYQRLRVEVIDVTSAQATVLFRVDGQYLRDAANNVIRHTLPLASIAACQVVAAIKNGDTNLETLNVDWMGCWQVANR